MPDATDTLTLTEKQTHLGIYDPYTIGTLVDIGDTGDTTPESSDAFTFSDFGALSGTEKEGSDSGTLEETDSQVKYDFTANTATVTDAGSVGSGLPVSDSGTLSESGGVTVGVLSVSGSDSGTLSESHGFTVTLADADSLVIISSHTIDESGIDVVYGVDDGALSAVEALIASLGSSDTASFSDASSILKETGQHRYDFDTATLAESVAITATLVHADAFTLSATLDLIPSGEDSLVSDSFSLSQEYGAVIVPGTFTGLADGDASMLAGLDATPGITQRLEGDTDLIP